MTDKILYVDDDPRTLHASQRRLRKHFKLETAVGGKAGLEAIRRRGPFAVIIADLRMPAMDGIAFLTEAQALAPDSVRVMLTGQADLDAAMMAVNRGHIFRFLTKPCPEEMLISTLETALEQYNLIADRQRAEQALRESEARYRLLVEGSFQGLYIHRDGRIRFANPATSRLFGYDDAQDLIGQEMRTLLPPHEVLRLAGYWHAHLQGEPAPTRYEFQGQRRDGTLIWLESLISVVTWDGQPALLETVLDITQRKEIERVKDDLLSMVSHELRTPLTSLRGFAELMLRYDYPIEKRRRFLTIMNEEGIRLTNLLNDFLDTQRIESGRQTYHFTPIALAPMVQAIIAVLAQSTDTHRFCLDISDTLPLVRADAERLHQVLFNLLSNAIKFSPDGGDIHLGARQKGPEVVVWVADQGIGMTQNALEKVFTKFYRIENAETRCIGGTGLGLALVKGIVEAHRGRVWVESVLGQGSTFWFTLPVADQDIPMQQGVITAAVA